MEKQNFIQVEYDLLASTKLDSTGKLFIAYILGWQKNDKICRETNNNLAKRMGLKHSGIRSLLKRLNKYDFFESIVIDFDSESRTSGHIITVDESLLKSFLNGTVNDSKKNEQKENGLPIQDSSKAKENTLEEDLLKFESEQVKNDGEIIIIDAFKDVINDNQIMKNCYERFGRELDYVEAKVKFEDNELVDGFVFKVTDSKGVSKYIDSSTYNLFLKNNYPNIEE